MIELKRGYDLPKQDRARGGTPIISSSGVSGYHSRPMAKGPGVITGRYGTLGQVFYVEEDFWPLNTTLYVRNFKGNDPKFVSYFLRSLDFSAFSDKAAVPGLNRNHLHLAPIQFPTGPDEQRAIASVLGCLDSKIETNLGINETLETMARAMFKDWFVNFGPTRAKMTGIKPYLAPEIWNHFPDRLDEDGRPVGWEEHRLSELCTLGRGASPRPINDYMNGEVPWIKIADATSAEGPFLFQTKERVTAAGAKQSVEVTPGDLILSNSATCGVPIFVELNGCIHDGWLYFKNLTKISKLYLFHVLSDLTSHFIQIADGSVQKNLNTHLVGEQKVLIPSKIILDAFDAFAIPSFNKIRENSLESRTLASTRDFLLPKLMSGEIRLHDARSSVEAALAKAS